MHVSGQLNYAHGDWFYTAYYMKNSTTNEVKLKTKNLHFINFIIFIFLQNYIMTA